MPVLLTISFRRAHFESVTPPAYDVLCVSNGRGYVASIATTIGFMNFVQDAADAAPTDWELR